MSNLSYDVFVSETPPTVGVLPNGERKIFSPVASTLIYGSENAVLQLARLHPGRLIAVVLPELVERRWLYYFLHDQRWALLKLLLYIKGNGRIVVINVPWYLES